MLFTFFGSESVFFGDAFFGNNGVDVNELSASSTQIVVQQPDTGVITTVTGTGFTFDSSGDVTGGTITGFSFAVNGTTQATVTGISWNVVAFSNALDEIDLNDNYAPMAALLSLSSSLTFDGSTATGPMNLSDMADLAPLITTGMTVTGTDFDDLLVGGAGNDTITPGGNTGYDFLLGTTGNDQYDFRGASGDDFYEMSYAQVSGSITVNVDVPGGTGSIVGSGWTDTLLGVADAATASYGGIGVAGTTGNDTFNINTGSGWVSAGGGDGSDTYNLTLDGGARVYFNWAGYNLPGPTQGLDVNLVTGVVSNDGFGNTDQINILSGTGRLEIRATYNDDMILGSARNESFILERGNDTLDGGDGFDRLRYDRSGVDSVTVDLGTGMVWGTWHGHSFTHDVTGIEWVRGSRGGDDLMFGDGNANRLDGRGGNDTLNGGGGQDSLLGGDGNDLLNIGNYAGGDGGLGNDTLDFSTVTTGWAWVDFDSYTAGVTVTVDGAANTGTATSGSNTDTLVNVANPMAGGGFTVAAARGGGNDTFNINTAAGQWIALRGNGGVDTYNLTGQGAVRLEFRSSNGATVDLSTGMVSDDGYGNVETITGTVWELRGDTGNDNFTGSANGESFILAGGNDTLDGGLGFDRLNMDRSDMGSVTVDLSAGTATGSYDGAGFSHSVTGIEWVRGSDQNDVITGNSDNNLLQGQDGNDTLNGLGGDDTLEGGTGISVLDGGDGNDTLRSSLFDDTLFGGAGDDLRDAGGGNDTNWGGEGNDTFFAGAGEDLLSGANGNDLMWGGAGDDTVFGVASTANNL
jgi:Ca2+-binding RTX toxin-like protein